MLHVDTPLAVAVEITVRRIGPAPAANLYGARIFGPRIFPFLAGDGLQGFQLNGTDVPHDLVHVEFYGFAPVDDDGWYGGRLMLRLSDGSTIGPRPYLYFSGPSDVPVHTLVRSPHYGTYAVGLQWA